MLQRISLEECTNLCCPPDESHHAVTTGKNQERNYEVNFLIYPYTCIIYTYISLLLLIYLIYRVSSYLVYLGR